MLNLFIIGVGYLDLLKIGKLNSLIISHGLHDWDINSQTGGMLFLVLPLVSDMLM